MSGSIKKKKSMIKHDVNVLDTAKEWVSGNNKKVSN